MLGNAYLTKHAQDEILIKAGKDEMCKQDLSLYTTVND